MFGYKLVSIDFDIPVIKIGSTNLLPHYVTPLT